MDAEELLGIEPALDGVHRLAQEVGGRPDVQADVVAGGFDPVDLVHPQEEQPSGRLDHQTVGARLIPAQVLDQGEQAPAQVAGFVALDLLARALQGLGEALAVERLEDVVEGADLEGLQGVLVVRGDEDHQRHALRPDRVDHVEAAHLRHLHVQEHQVRRVVLDRHHGFFAVAALRRHLDVRLERQQCRQPLARQRFVVDDQRLDFLHGRDPVMVPVMVVAGASVPLRRQGRGVEASRPSAAPARSRRTLDVPWKGDDHREARLLAVELEAEVGPEEPQQALAGGGHADALVHRLPALL